MDVRLCGGLADGILGCVGEALWKVDLGPGPIFTKKHVAVRIEVWFILLISLIYEFAHGE